MSNVAPIRHRVRRSTEPRIVSQSRPSTHVAVFESELGWIAVATVARRLIGVTFGHAEREAALAALDSQGGVHHSATSQAATTLNKDEAPWLADICARFKAFAAGEFEDFRDVEIDDGHLTPFERSVVQACRAIPYGETMSYGQLATKVGRPGAARAVGRVMATNRFPLVVPCHRVLAASGRLGGYSAPQGLAMKRRLLAMEGGEVRPPKRPK